VNKTGSERVLIHKLFNIGIRADQGGYLGILEAKLAYQSRYFEKRLRNVRSKTINYLFLS